MDRSFYSNKAKQKNKRKKKKASQERKSMGSGSSSEGQAMYWTSSFFLTWSGIRGRPFDCVLFWEEKMSSMVCLEYIYIYINLGYLGSGCHLYWLAYSYILLPFFLENGRIVSPGIGKKQQISVKGICKGKKKADLFPLSSLAESFAGSVLCEGSGAIG